MKALRAALLSALAALPLSVAPVEAQQERGQAAPRTAPRGQAAQPKNPAAQPNSPMVPQPKREKIFEVGATWIATSLNGKPFTGERPSFTIDQQYQARGFGGCNNFTAVAYPLREQRLAISPLLPTKKSCAKAAMDIEKAFFVALRYAQQWEQQGSTLTLKTPSGELRFERAL